MWRKILFLIYPQIDRPEYFILSFGQFSVICLFLFWMASRCDLRD